MREIQNEIGMVHECGRFHADAYLVVSSEASANVAFSNLATNEEGQPNEELPNIQKALRKGDRPSRHRRSGRKNSVNPGRLMDANQVHVLESAKNEQAAKSLPHKATGPRTPEGKKRSKYNALKHGAFSKKLLIKGESQAENKALWNGLWEDFKPQGTLATEIFMDIFLNRLNNRRFHKATHALIAEKVQFLEIERAVAQQARAWYLERWGRAEDGMLKPGANCYELRKCIEILQQVRRSIEKHGFYVTNDRHLLTKLYGTDMDGKSIGILDIYLQAESWALEAKGEKKNAEIEILKRTILQLLEDEIGYVTAMEKAIVDMERTRSKYRCDQALVLSQKDLDRLMRLETHLTRDLVRKLSLFEQAMRICKASPVLPPVEVDDKL